MPKKVKNENSDVVGLSGLQKLQLRTFNSGKWEKGKTDGDQLEYVLKKGDNVIAKVNQGKTQLTFFPSDSFKASRGISSVVIEGEELRLIITRIKGLVNLR